MIQVMQLTKHNRSTSSPECQKLFFQILLLTKSSTSTESKYFHPRSKYFKLALQLINKSLTLKTLVKPPFDPTPLRTILIVLIFLESPKHFADYQKIKKGRRI